MRASSVLLTLSLLTFPSLLRADPPGSHDITLAVEPSRERRPSLAVLGAFGLLAHATTGTIPRDGYDSGSAPALGGTARLLVPLAGCRCLWHGAELNYAWSSGTSLGLERSSAWTQHTVDASYAMRVELPCLRSGDRRWWVTGSLGLSMRRADAGMGDGEDPSRANERASLAARYDHTALGWRLGGEMAVTFGRLLVGVALDLRDLYGIDTELRRTTVMGAALRVGVDFSL